jgi:hypothetical protein
LAIELKVKQAIVRPMAEEDVELWRKAARATGRRLGIPTWAFT